MKLKSKHNLNRYNFLQFAGGLFGAAAITTFLQACSQAGLIPPTPGVLQPTSTKTAINHTPSITATKMPAESTEEIHISTSTQTPLPTQAGYTAQVALIKTNDRTAGVRQAIELLGINPVAGKDVLLKPNFNSADPSPGSTHLDILRSLVLKLQEMGAGKITVGDRSGMGNTQAVMRTLGVLDLAQELGFETLVFDELGLNEWKQIGAQNSHWKQGYLMALPCLDCGALVQTCNLKTHGYGGIFTLSLKNSVGMVAKRHPTSGYQYMSELHSSPNQRKMIAEINTAYKPDLVVLDGVQAFTTGGPDKGTLVSPGVILAGTDRIALDAAGVAILRQYGASFNGSVFEQEQIARAVELGLGANSPNQIEFVTPDSQSAKLAEQIMQTMLNT